MGYGGYGEGLSNPGQVKTDLGEGSWNWFNTTDPKSGLTQQ
jgi:hypothetical protein